MFVDKICFVKLYEQYYFKTPGILAGGTNEGKVAMWKHVVTKPQQRKLEGQEKWELQSPAVLEGETQLSQIQVREKRKEAFHNSASFC